MATKLGGMVTYHEELQPIKSHDTLIPWSWEFMWQTTVIIYPLEHCLKPQEMAGWYFPLAMATKIGKMVTYIERLHNNLYSRILRN